MVAALIRSRLHLFTDGFYYPNICKRAIENSYNPKQKKKADQKQHGIGLLSVSHTLEKYHGDLKHYVEDNNKYHTTVTMFNGTE